MTRQDILNQYRVGPNGVILSPGKFESEMLYVPYFWDAMLNGDGETEYDGLDRPETSFDVEPADLAEFPELKGIARLTIWETDQGFVYCVSD